MKKYTYEDLEKENKQQQEVIKEQQKEIMFYIKQLKEYKEFTNDLCEKNEKLNEELIKELTK